MVLILNWTNAFKW